MADKTIVSADEQLLADTEYLLNQKKSRRLIKTSLAEVTSFSGAALSSYFCVPSLSFQRLKGSILFTNASLTPNPPSCC